MSKFVETEYGSTKEILKFPDHYVALAVMVDDEGIAPNENGKKIVPKGTIVGGISGSVIDDLTIHVGEKIVFTAGDPQGEPPTEDTWSAIGAEGVLKNDVDVTYGPKEGAMVIHGFIAIDKLPYDNNGAVVAAVRADAAEAFSMIKFIK